MFKLGKVVATPNALGFMEEHQIDAMALLRRHVMQDTDCCKEDHIANKHAIENGERVFSVFKEGIWIITEWDRSYTTILKPEDY